jgi:hypothetical protein
MFKFRACFIVIVFLISSCATILNEPKTSVVIETNIPSRVIMAEQDTLKTEDNRVQLDVLRGKEPIKLMILADSSHKNLTIKSKNSFLYYYNIIGNYGIGMLIDRKTPKRYVYPKTVYVDMKLKSYFTYKPFHEKGDFFFHFSLPYINRFNLWPQGETRRKRNTGYLGMAIGLDYYHKSNQFLNLRTDVSTDFVLPFPVPIDFFGELEQMFTSSVSFSNNHKIGRFTVGYGINLGRQTWNLSYRGDRDSFPRSPACISNTAFGLNISAYRAVRKNFQLGIIYRPTFYKFSVAKPFKYEHLISVDFAWKKGFFNLL